jgi:hypothetical protein
VFFFPYFLSEAAGSGDDDESTDVMAAEEITLDQIHMNMMANMDSDEEDESILLSFSFIIIISHYFYYYCIPSLVMLFVPILRYSD